MQRGSRPYPCERAKGEQRSDRLRDHDPEGSPAHTAATFEAWATKVPELWDPSTREWCSLAEQATARMYHSTALLLPDGTVISMAGGRRQVSRDYENAEIFTPPYLLSGAPRPVVQPLRTVEVDYDDSFTLSLDPASPVESWSDIDRVTLVGIASTTHGFDQSTHFMTLDWTPPVGPTGPSTSVASPINPNIMPPGWYMVFTISKQGVPSVARYLRLVPTP